MSFYTINDPDLMEAAKELDNEFPGAEYDLSLHKYLQKNKRRKKVINKIIFHGIFYSAFTIVIFSIFKTYNSGIFSGIISSMIYGLIWFLIYFIFKPDKSGESVISRFEKQIMECKS